ncbi:hypothetical protein ILYODFUR_003866 [Ilyodon furcidens]|uniref:Uncharacterized protein n=1 Tax=Ilyodon furcidens TaxID=33524 RepID=A0ABV0UH42_9TELE
MSADYPACLKLTNFISLCLKPEMWQKVEKFKGAEYFCKALCCSKLISKSLHHPHEAGKPKLGSSSFDLRPAWLISMQINHSMTTLANKSLLPLKLHLLTEVMPPKNGILEALTHFPFLFLPSDSSA